MTLSFLFREFHLTFFLRLFNDDELLVCLFGRIFIFPSILNDRFEEQNILGCTFFLSAICICHYSPFLPLNFLLKVSSPFRSSLGVLQVSGGNPALTCRTTAVARFSFWCSCPGWELTVHFWPLSPQEGPLLPWVPSCLWVTACEVWILARPWLHPTCFFQCGPSFISLVMENLFWWMSGHSHR